MSADYPEALTAATQALAAEPGIGDTTAARLYAEKALSAAAPHILADFSKRTAGMAEALNNAAAIIEDRDRQLAAARAEERERIRTLFGDWIEILMSEPNSHPPSAWKAAFDDLLNIEPS
jgi:hypothetical protein